MAYLIAIAVSLILFGGFLLITALEGARGARLFGSGRAALDARVARVSFVLQHVDWSAFLAHLTRSGLERLLHDIAHTSLLVVRFLERELTRAVRALRSRREATLPEAGPRPSPLAGTVTYLQKTLRSARRKPRDVDMRREL